MDTRLPAHFEVSGLLRAVEAAGGFATVLAKGERDAGTILVVCCENGHANRLFERMPQAEGDRRWVLTKTDDSENPDAFSQYLARRRNLDRDIWIIELDIAKAERFIGVNPEKD